MQVQLCINNYFMLNCFLKGSPFIFSRLVLRCRQDARVRFAKMRSDVLVKIELLDQKHGIEFQLFYFLKSKQPNLLFLVNFRDLHLGMKDRCPR